MKSHPIYKRGSDGKLRTWQYEVSGDQYRTIAGIHGGNLVTSAWTTCFAKNAGKANYVNAYIQAVNEAEAAEKAKLKREYRRTVAELDNVMKGPMLAATYKGGLTFPVYSQPKLDGIRALITKDGAFTRELQPHTNVGHITRALAPVFEKYPDVIFDGELYNHDLKDNFNRICQLVRKQTVTEDQAADICNLVQFHVYDIADDKLSFGQRRTLMGDLIGDTFARRQVIRVETYEVGSQEDLDALNGAYTSQGYEGQMVRLDAPYEFDTRSKHLLKRKEFDTAEFKILKIEEGEGNWAGYAKRVEFDIGDGRICGGGIRGDREEMRHLLVRWNGGLMTDKPTDVTIRYFGLTPDGIPRFPVAIDFHQRGRVD